MAKHDAKGLNIFRSHRKNSYSTVSVSFFGLPAVQSSRDTRAFRKLLEKADVPAIRIHDIRHTFASLLLSQGEPLNYVKEQLGHASIQTTVDVYGHIVPGSNRNAVNRLDDEGDFGLRAVKGAG